MTKRALVLGGGAAKGAFQAGVIYRLAQEHSWDIVSGVSVGAINGACIAMYDSKNVKIAVDRLVEYWKYNLNNDKVFKKWIPIEWLNYPIAYFKNGLYNFTPLKNFLTSRIDINALKTSDVDYIIGATSFNDGTFKQATKTNAKIIDWILASASFPMAFPPVTIDGKQYIDGALRNSVPIREAIRAGATEIDVVITDPLGFHKKENKKPNNILDIFLRTSEIISDESYVYELQKICAQYNVKITVYSPKEYLTNEPLDFSQKEILKLLEIGLQEVDVWEYPSKS
jgi:predicted acylesterase/phospholipase RssA